MSKAGAGGRPGRNGENTESGRFCFLLWIFRGSADWVGSNSCQILILFFGLCIRMTF